jgi:hypothetical protein
MATQPYSLVALAHRIGYGRLAPWLTDPRLTLQLILVAPGDVHHPTCIVPAGSKARTVPLRAVAGVIAACHLCGRTPVTECGPSPMLQDLHRIVTAHDAADAATAYAADPGRYKGDGKRRQIVRQLRTAAVLLGEFTDTALAAERESASALLDGAHRTVDGAAARLADDKEWALNEITAALIPEDLREYVKVSMSPVLIGVSAAGSRSARLTRILTAYTIHTTDGAVVLQAPRAMFDYLNQQRSEFTGPAWLTAACIDGVSQQAVRAAAQLWNPLQPGPLASMTVAVTAGEAVAH